MYDRAMGMMDGGAEEVGGGNFDIILNALLGRKGRGSRWRGIRESGG